MTPEQQASFMDKNIMLVADPLTQGDLRLCTDICIGLAAARKSARRFLRRKNCRYKTIRLLCDQEEVEVITTETP